MCRGKVKEVILRQERGGKVNWGAKVLTSPLPIKNMQIHANINCYIWIRLPLNCHHILLVNITILWAASSLMGSIHKPHVSLETWVVHLSGLGWSLVWKPARNLTRSSLKYQGARRNSSNLLTTVYCETVMCSLTFTQEAHPYCLNSRHMDTCLTLLKASRALRAGDMTTCCFHRVTITMAAPLRSLHHMSNTT